MFDAYDQHCMLYERNGIMDHVRAYILQVAAAAVVCSLAKTLAGEKNVGSSMIKIICGVIMCITVIKPLMDIRFESMYFSWDRFMTDAQGAVYAGQHAADDHMNRIIKDAAEAYILDKASVFGADIAAEVTLSGDKPPIPCAVSISGVCAPYAKSFLADVITKELGISQEAQTWSIQHH